MARLGLQVLLAVTAVSAEFPKLGLVLLDVCGSGQFTLTQGSPCQYNIFGFALAWSECAHSHPFAQNVQAFRSCVMGCSSQDLCQRACRAVPEEKAKTCGAECQLVASCMNKSLAVAVDIASAEQLLASCFTSGNVSLPMPQQEADALTAAQAATKAATAATVAGALTATQADTLNAAQVEATVAQDATAAKQELLKLVNLTQNLTQNLTKLSAAWPALVQLNARGRSAKDPCNCDYDVARKQIGSSLAGQVGCATWGRESTEGSYCFVTGGAECRVAKPSQEVPGLFWRSCEPAAFKELFPDSCELNRLQEPVLSIPMTPVVEQPPPRLVDLADRGASGMPIFATEIQAWSDQRAAWGAPLPDDWHAEHYNVFLSAKAIPQKEPKDIMLISMEETEGLPPALLGALGEEPHVYAMAQSDELRLASRAEGPPPPPRTPPPPPAKLLLSQVTPVAPLSVALPDHMAASASTALDSHINKKDSKAELMPVKSLTDNLHNTLHEDLKAHIDAKASEPLPAWATLTTPTVQATAASTLPPAAVASVVPSALRSWSSATLMPWLALAVASLVL